MRLRAWAALCALVFVGCAGPLLTIRAPRLRYPVSFSPVVYGADYQLLGANDLDVVHSFARMRASCQRDADGNPSWDLSDALNRSIELHGGEAVTNLTVTLVPPGGETPNESWLRRGLSCVPVTVTGQIVRRRRPLAPAPPRP